MTDDPEVTDPRNPYKRQDVVAELDAWLGAWEGPDDYRLTVKRARDEIVRLRKIAAWPSPELHALTKERDELRATLERHDRLVVTAVAVATPAIRDAALEEAAQMCFRANPASNPNAMGHAIRALKDKPP